MFGGPLDHEQERYPAWKDAERGHAAMVARVLATAAEKDADSAKGERK